MFCKQCGAQNDDGAGFCKFCGAKLEMPATNVAAQPTVQPVQQPIPDQQPVQQPQQVFVQQSGGIPAEYTPISMWGYFGYELLFSIPCVGFIILCIFAFGGSKNVNVKNFARSYFCYFIILAIIFLFAMLLGGTAGILSGMFE